MLNSLFNGFLWLCLLVLLLLGWSDLKASELYTWVYAGYTHTPKEITDPYISQYGEDWATVEIGTSYCQALDQSSDRVCYLVYYQHSSHTNISEDKGINSGNIGIEYRHRWF